MTDIVKIIITYDIDTCQGDVEYEGFSKNDELSKENAIEKALELLELDLEDKFPSNPWLHPKKWS